MNFTYLAAADRRGACWKLARSLVGLSIASSCLSAIALSKNSDDALAQYRPIIVAHVEGSAPSEDIQSRMVEGLTQALQRGALSAIATDLYASGEGFPAHGRPIGPVSGMLRALNYANIYFDEALQGDLGEVLARNGTAAWSVAFEGFLTDDQTPLPTFESHLVPPNLGLMWEVWKATLLEGLPIDTADMINKSLATPVVHAQDIPGGVERLYRHGRRLYDLLNSPTNRSRFLPLYFQVMMNVDGSRITISFQSTMKPGEFRRPKPPSPTELIEPQQIYLRPVGLARQDTAAITTGPRPVMQMQLQRSWGPAVALSHSMAIATFGDMVGESLREVKPCRGEGCIGKLGTMPVIELKLQPATLMPNDSAASNATQFWPIFWARLKAAYGVEFAASKLRDLVTAMDRVQRKYITVFIALNQLVINFENPDDPHIIPELSSTPVVVRRMIPGRTDQPITYQHMLFSRTYDDETRVLLQPWTQADYTHALSTLIGRYSKSKLLALKNGVSFRVYEQVLSAKVADDLSGEIKNELPAGIAELDHQVSSAINSMMDAVMDLFK